MAERFQRVAADFALLCLLDESIRSAKLASRKNIFRDVEIGQHVQFLMNHGDSPARGVRAAPKGHRLSIQQKRTAERPFDTGQNAHERRFARAIFSDEHIHFPAEHAIGDALERGDPAILLHNINRFEHGVPGSRGAAIGLCFSAGHAVFPRRQLFYRFRVDGTPDAARTQRKVSNRRIFAFFQSRTFAARKLANRG